MNNFERIFKSFILIQQTGLEHTRFKVFPVFGQRKQRLSHMARLLTTAETEAEALPTVWLIL